MVNFVLTGQRLAVQSSNLGFGPMRFEGMSLIILTKEGFPISKLCQPTPEATIENAPVCVWTFFRATYLLEFPKASILQECLYLSRKDGLQPS